MRWSHLLCSVCAFVACGMHAWGQATKKPSPAATRTLDATAQKLEADFLKGLSDLASSYEEAGDKDKAEAMLQAILKIRPDAEPVKAKLKELEESVFKDQQEVIDVDTSKGWISTGLMVEKGAKLRLEATGTYKLIVNDDLGPEGYRSEDGKGEDYFEGAPAGALIAIVVPNGVAPAKKRDGGPQPFMVGTQKELEPKESGILVMRVNSPATAKCVGRLKIRVSGNFAKAAR